MIPIHDSDAPAIDRGVLARLKRLDPLLRVTWSKWELDLLSGVPIIATPTGKPVFNPQYFLWRKDPYSSHHHFVMSTPQFGHEQVLSLEMDPLRSIGPEAMLSRRRELRAHRDAQERARLDDIQREKVKANKSRINDLLFEGKSSSRDAKIFSAPGLSRGTPGRVEKDSREDGWELPEQK